MKLIDLLKITDQMSYIIIWDSTDDEDPIFEGSVFDVPWTLTEMFLYKGLDDGECAISIRKTEKYNDSAMVVCVSEKEPENEVQI